MIQIERLPFVILAFISLLTGLVSGLQRIGWNFSVNNISASHGAIMVGGFIGSLIILEKIIPLKMKSLYLLPAVSGGSVILFYLEMPEWSMVTLLVASAGLGIVFLIYLIRERSLVYAMMFAAALCWFAGNIILIKKSFYPTALPWWMAFVLLVITSERLELMKFLPVSKGQKLTFVVTLAVFIGGCALSFHGMGSYLAAFSLLGTSLWLMRHDVVGINLRKDGLARYVGVALLSGYFALLIAGIFVFLLTNHAFGYDIIIHCFFLGFVFSMIFAHGPIILPGLLGISLKPYNLIFYFWLFLLHVSWVIRSVSGIAFEMQLRKLSGLLSAIAILGYFISLAVVSIRSHRAKAI